MEPIAKPPTSEADIEPHEAGKIWAAIDQLVGDTDLSAISPDEFVDLGLSVTPLLPGELRRRLIEYRRYAPDGDVMLLRGLLPDGVDFGPTATAPWAPPTGPAQKVSLLLAGIMVLFGEPFNYKSLYNGRITQNMVPVKKMEYTQTSQSSTGMLDWHCEDSFRDDRCDYAGLICLRGDPDAASKYAQARDVQLSPEVEKTLREPRYHVRPDPAHVITGEVSLRPLPLLTGSAAAPEIAYDTHHLEVIDEADTEAADALRELGHCLDKVAISHVMERGDLLIFDNRRVVHARTPFAARFDGTDRWLMRAMICASAVQFRRWGERIPE